MSDETEEKVKNKGLVVKTRVYEVVKADTDGEGMQISSKLFAKIDAVVKEIILAAKNRAILNKRKTIFPRDL